MNKYCMGMPNHDIRTYNSVFEYAALTENG